METDIRDTVEKEVVEPVLSALNSVITCHNIIYGHNSDGVEPICNELYDKIKEMCHNFKKSIENRKQNMIDQIESILKNCVKLSNELKLDNQIDNLNEMSLTDMLTALSEQQTRFGQIKSERLEQYESLKDAEEVLCKDLKETPMEACRGIPSEDYLRDLNRHVCRLNEHKEQLVGHLTHYRAEVRKLMEKIEVTPITPIELFCFNDSTTIAYSIDTAEKLESLKGKLEMEQKRMVEEADSIRQVLSTLWARIEAPISVREKILRECNGFTKGTITKLKAELNRCEKIKQESMANYISKLKEELEDYWAMCKFSDAEKERCNAFFSTHCTEDVANVLELELANVKDFYIRYEDIYLSYQRRQELWDRLRQLEESTKDANRLFNNRGGALLKEENERKKIQKLLPKVEEKLQVLLGKFKAAENREFTIDGQNLQHLISSTWEQWHKKKEQTKTARKVANANTLAVESQLGSQRKLPANGTHMLQTVSAKLKNGDGASEYCANTLHSTGSSTALSSLTKSKVVSTPDIHVRNVTFRRGKRRARRSSF